MALSLTTQLTTNTHVRALRIPDEFRCILGGEGQDGYVTVFQNGCQVKHTGRAERVERYSIHIDTSTTSHALFFGGVLRNIGLGGDVF